MFPHLLRAGGFTVHTYGLLVAVGLILGTQLALRLALKDGVPRERAESWIYSLLAWFVVSGLLGGRLLYVALFPEDFHGDWLSVLKVWQGGLVAYGALAAALAAFGLWTRIHRDAPWRKVLDWLAPTLALGHALGRLGCFAAGCCYGKPTDLPWGVTFSNPWSLAPLDIPLHPTQLYESAFLAGLSAWLLKRFKASREAGSPPGRVFAEYLMIYGAGRFLNEWVRAEPRLALGLTGGQWGSLAALAVGLALWLRVFRPVDRPGKS